MSKKANNQSKGFYAVLTIALVSLAVVALGGVYYYKQADGLRGRAAQHLYAVVPRHGRLFKRH